MAKSASKTSALKAKPGPKVEAPAESDDPVGPIEIKRARYERFRIWVVGDTPLICNAWSHKAKEEMLGKQLGRIRPGREKRDPQTDFENSLYEMGEGSGQYGFPATGFKKALLAVAHKDKGVPRTAVMASLWIDHEIISVRPALAGARCNMPLLRIWGSKPEMREDMTKIGVGLRRTANLTYRAEFFHWAFLVTGRYNADVLSLEALGFLAEEAGLSTGLGEWRNERSGVFGAFHVADPAEAEAWYKFRAGKGPMPTPAPDKMAA